MAWKVNWTEAAWKDLESTANYIAEDSPHYAAGFVHAAREAARSLTHFAERGHIVSEWGDKNVRELFVQSYRLIYEVTEPNVYILALIHGARELRPPRQ